MNNTNYSSVGGFKSLKLRSKLILSHGLIVLMCIVVIIGGILGMGSIKDKLEIMYNGPTKAFDDAGELLYSIADLQRAFVQVLYEASNGAPDIATFKADLDSHLVTISTSMNSLYVILPSQESIEIITNIGALMTEATGNREAFIACIESGDYTKAYEIYETQYRPLLNSEHELAIQLKNTIHLYGTQLSDDAESRAYSSQAVLFFLGLAAVVIAIVMTVIITRSITIPVNQLVFASEKMNDGDLSVADSITYIADDELGVLARSMKETISNLREYVTEIDETLGVMATGDLTKSSDDITDFRGDFASIKVSMLKILKSFNATLTDIQHAAEQVDTGSSQVASGSQSLSQGAVEQASSIQELAATVSQVSTEVQKAGEFAASASSKTAEAGELMNGCNNQMKEMVAAMDDIANASQEISKIIKTIEDIAFQTNILALNAAVEAARAGAAGKGFAVVADEVRNLAAKSAEASNSTSVLIENAVNAVNRGTKLAADTADILNSVVTNAMEVSEMVNQIAVTSEEQGIALQQVTDGIEQISSVVQVNSATAEESAAASQELFGQANVLNNLVGRFQLFEEQE